MSEFFDQHPGWPQLAAALMPLLVGTLTLLTGTARGLARPGVVAPSTFWATLNTGCMAVSAGLSVVGLLGFYSPSTKFGERVEWIRLGPVAGNQRAVALDIGYHVDFLTALMFAVVTVVATLVFVFSLGYMADERDQRVEDHEAHVERRGRLGRFYAYLSLFVAAMLGLLLADNLLQLFVCWELVGVCSFLLVGFYHERPTAAAAATKAFVVNRVGDAGFLVAIVIAWATFGTLDINVLTDRVGESYWSIHMLETLNGQHPDDLDGMLSSWKNMGKDDATISSWLNELRESAEAFVRDKGHLTYRLWLLMGLGLFLGAVGKSAQVPLHVWLPDAMAGPTPVSALIHAATMVAAGVYLVARCVSLFPSEILLVVAYTGVATMTLGATAACVQTDIKRVLAYSTCSQLGVMMLALGLGVATGGWAAGMFHLVTHAFFKALLFLAAGSVIYGLHHEQDLRYMGGLRGRMPITAVAMLVGVLAIAGCPPFSGWYSKEAILSAAAVHGLLKPHHAALFVIPLLTAGLTAFYMFRLWLLAFAGQPRDTELHEHAHESPRIITIPLLTLVTLSLVVGWGWPVWEPNASLLGKALEDFSERFGRTIDGPDWRQIRAAKDYVESYHHVLEAAAGSSALIGAFVAVLMYAVRTPIFAADAPGGVRSFLVNAWGFDAVYRVLIVRPILRLGSMSAAADKRPGSADGTGSDPAAHSYDFGTLDGWLNAVGLSALIAGGATRRVQAGFLRGYVLALGLTVVGLLGMLAVLLP